MTWAEFKLRLLSYKRVQKGEALKLRRLAWITFIAPYQDPKKLRGMTESRWWKIEEKEKGSVSESHKDRFMKEMKKYLAKKEHGRA